MNVTTFESDSDAAWNENLTESDFGYYDELRLNSKLIRRDGNVDVFMDPTSKQAVGICHINSLLRLTTADASGNFQPNGPEINAAAAAVLAMHHFNTGDGSVVPDLEGINTRCPVRFTMAVNDTSGSSFESLSLLAEIVGGGSCSNFGRNKMGGELFPCAILGATRSACTEPTSMLSSAYDLPQMSYTAGSEQLSDRLDHPLFSRVIIPVSATAEASILYLNEALNANYCAVLYINDDFGVSYLRKFQVKAQESGMRTVAVAYPPFFGAEEMEQAIKSLKESRYRYFFGIIYPEHFDRVMEEASRQNIVGDDYFWLIGNDNAFVVSLNEEGSLLERAYEGVGFLKHSAGRKGLTGFDNFHEAWLKMDDDAKSYINQIIPNPPGFLDNFTPLSPVGWALFAYDTMATLGLASCNITEDNHFFDGTEFYHSIQNMQFNGASGLIKFDNNTGSRATRSAIIEVRNIQRKGTKDGFVKFEVVPTLALQPNAEGNDWDLVNITPFIYADGTTTPPHELPPINNGAGMNHNYIGNLRFLGYVLFSIIAALSISFAAWTFVKRKSRVVRASQPSFLIMVCAGVVIMAPSIITLSVDDEYFSIERCDFACMATPWLLSTGFVTSISALFSKTWRINMILNNPNRFQRVKVEAKDVLAPFAIFLTSNFIILILWSALAPLEYERFINEDGTDEFNRPISSYGVCTNSEERGTSSTPYASSLIALNFLIVSFTAYQAYRARKLSTDYSESKYIAICVISQLQAIIIGVPIILLMRQNEVSHLSTFLVGSLIVFIVCSALLLLIFVPKLYHHREDELEKRKKAELKRQRANENGTTNGDGTVNGDGATNGVRHGRRSSIRDTISSSLGLHFQILKSNLQNGVIIDSVQDSPPVDEEDSVEISE